MATCPVNCPVRGRDMERLDGGQRSLQGAVTPSQAMLPGSKKLTVATFVSNRPGIAASSVALAYS